MCIVCASAVYRIQLYIFYKLLSFHEGVHAVVRNICTLALFLQEENVFSCVYYGVVEQGISLKG